MKNYVQKGDTITITAPGAIASGAFVAIGSLFGFAVTSVDAGDDVAILTNGVFETEINAVAPVNVGDAVYFDGVGLTNEAIDGTGEFPAENPTVGVAVSPADAGAASVIYVKI